VHCSLKRITAALCPLDHSLFHAVVLGEVARDELCNVRRVRAARAGRSDTAAVDLLKARPIIAVLRDAAANRATEHARGEVRDGSPVARESGRKSRRTGAVSAERRGRGRDRDRGASAAKWAGKGRDTFWKLRLSARDGLADEAQCRNRRATAPKTRVPGLPRSRRGITGSFLEFSLSPLPVRFSPSFVLSPFVSFLSYISEATARASEKARLLAYAGSRSRLWFSLSFGHCRTYTRVVTRRKTRKEKKHDSDWTAMRIEATEGRARFSFARSRIVVLA